MMAFIVMRAGRFRKGWIFAGGGLMAGGILAVLFMWMSSHGAGSPSLSGIDIRREGDRLFAQPAGLRIWPVDVVLPPVSGELLPESETRFFERLSGVPTLTFSRNDTGGVNGFTLDFGGAAFSYAKISGRPPEPPRLIARR
jgi:hypothetical protein